MDDGVASRATVQGAHLGRGEEEEWGWSCRFVWVLAMCPR